VTPPTYDEAPLLLQGKTWEAMVKGTRFRTAARTVTETDLVNFVCLGGFIEPLFLDASHAGGAGYTGRLIPGGLIYVIAEGLVLQTGCLHGTGIAFMHMDLDVLRPVYVSDTLHAVVEITESRAASRGIRGVVTSTVTVYNQDGAEVLVYRPVRLIRGRESARQGG
jgi:acyl dehydratase